jgi:hypothetical protein
MTNRSDILRNLTDYTSKQFYEKHKKDISLYYVFFHLFNQQDEPDDERITYNEICDDYKDKHSYEEIAKIYNIAMFNRLTNIKCTNVEKKKLCTLNCHLCEANCPENTQW